MSCKYCATTPNNSDPHNCASYEEAVRVTALRPYGCPWFTQEDRIQFLTAQRIPQETTSAEGE